MYGGPDGELGASLRYLSQRFSMPYPELKALLTDIGTAGSKWNRYIIYENLCTSSLDKNSLFDCNKPLHNPIYE